MPSLTAVYNPTLESVLMVENTILKSSGELGKHHIWKTSPRQMMYQPYQVILTYLSNRGRYSSIRRGKSTGHTTPGVLSGFFRVACACDEKTRLRHVRDTRAGAFI